MPINKVDFAGQTLIDLTKDTVTADKLLQGITAHDKAGNPISGTASGPKPEQEKELTITENGDYPITPDVGKVLSKVLAHVNVSSGGDVSPLTKITVEEWTPAQNSNTCPVIKKDVPGRLFFAIMTKNGAPLNVQEIIFAAVETSPTLPDPYKGTVVNWHKNGFNTYAGCSLINSGLVVTGEFLMGVTYVIVTCYGTF